MRLAPSRASLSIVDQNEAYYNEPVRPTSPRTLLIHQNYGETFWGTDNCNRLTAMKKVYDPQNILTCAERRPTGCRLTSTAATSASAGTRPTPATRVRRPSLP